MELKLKSGFDIALDQTRDGTGWVMYVRGNHRGLYIPVFLSHEELIRLKNALEGIVVKMRF